MLIRTILITRKKKSKHALVRKVLNFNFMQNLNPQLQNILKRVMINKYAISPALFQYFVIFSLLYLKRTEYNYTLW